MLMMHVKSNANPIFRLLLAFKMYLSIQHSVIQHLYFSNHPINFNFVDYLLNQCFSSFNYQLHVNSFNESLFYLFFFLVSLVVFSVFFNSIEILLLLKYVISLSYYFSVNYDRMPKRWSVDLFNKFFELGRTFVHLHADFYSTQTNWN